MAAGSVAAFHGPAAHPGRRLDVTLDAALHGGLDARVQLRPARVARTRTKTSRQPRGATTPRPAGSADDEHRQALLLVFGAGTGPGPRARRRIALAVAAPYRRAGDRGGRVRHTAHDAGWAPGLQRFSGHRRGSVAAFQAPAVVTTASVLQRSHAGLRAAGAVCGPRRIQERIAGGRGRPPGALRGTSRRRLARPPPTGLTFRDLTSCTSPVGLVPRY